MTRPDSVTYTLLQIPWRGDFPTGAST